MQLGPGPFFISVKTFIGSFRLLLLIVLPRLAAQDGMYQDWEDRGVGHEVDKELGESYVGPKS